MSLPRSLPALNTYNHVVKKVRPVKSNNGSKTDPIDIPTFDARFSKLREHMQTIDPIKEWEEIKAWLADNPTSLVETRNKVREHADIAQRATNLYIMAKSEVSSFEIKYKDRKQLWRVEALKYWEGQKAKGLRKQITEDMLTDWMIENHSELYMELEKRHDTLITIKDQLKSLADRIISKGHDLRKLLESETRRPVSPNWFDEKDSNSNR
jgi:hypothetical protein